jgi:hypothetical protein
MVAVPARGLDWIRLLLGQKLRAVTRYVLDLGNANDEWGHGLTELEFEHATVTIRPGPNEDYMLIESGPASLSGHEPSYWSRVELSRMEAWSSRHKGGRLRAVDCITDGYEDVALVFSFDTGDQFSVLLANTDLMIAEDLKPLAQDTEVVTPSLRERIEQP